MTGNGLALKQYNEDEELAKLEQGARLKKIKYNKAE